MISKSRLIVLAYNLIIMGEEILSTYSFDAEKKDIPVIAESFSNAIAEISADDYWDIIKYDFSSKEACVNIPFDFLKDFVVASYNTIKNQYGYDDDRMNLEIGVSPNECIEIGLSS